jgi:hypothetical protein
MILILRETIPSTSHNAPHNEEHGSHWPAGQRFKLLSKAKAKVHKTHYRFRNSVMVEQIGGEEVIVAFKREDMPKLFGVEVETTDQ